MKYFVYILESQKNNRYYIGASNNCVKRIQEHNKGSSKSTKPHRPWKLIYYEKYENIKEAYRREKYLKSLKKRKQIEKIIFKNNSVVRVPTDYYSVEDPRH